MSKTTVPERYATMYERALAGKLSPRKAIHCNCLECCCWSFVEAAACECYHCPLWKYSPAAKRAQTPEGESVESNED